MGKVKQVTEHLQHWDRRIHDSQVDDMVIHSTLRGCWAPGERRSAGHVLLCSWDCPLWGHGSTLCVHTHVSFTQTTLAQDSALCSGSASTARRRRWGEWGCAGFCVAEWSLNYFNLLLALLGTWMAHTCEVIISKFCFFSIFYKGFSLIQYSSTNTVTRHFSFHTC